MTYKAQLVVRARNKEGVDIIEKVKELAADEGKTFSDMAMDLLARGIGSEGDSTTAKARETAPEEDDEDDDVPSLVEVAPAAKEEEEEEKPAKNSLPPLSPEEAGPKVDPKLPAEDIFSEYVARRNSHGERAAAQILIGFFAVAGPAEGGKVKKLLQEEFSQEEFELLMKPIKETPEYAAYTERAIFGAPSPYSSQVN